MARRGFLRELLRGLRPQALQILTDVGATLVRLAGELAVSLFVLFSAWCFHWTGENLFPAGSEGQMAFDFVHLAGSVVALGMFAARLLREIFNKRHGGGGGN